MGRMPSGTVTFLFTDIEGSTASWERDAEAMDAALERHDRIIRDVLDRHRGYVFATTGDGFAVAFERPNDAVAAAAAMQADLAAAETLLVRVGVHTGAASERDGDYFGPPVNRAARIMAAAHGGQVLVSAATAALLTGEHPLVDLGTYRLKDLSAPEQLHQLGRGDFPRLRTLDVARHNLPVERTALIGREEDVREVVGLLGRHRLVTLLGIGGTGKTRLATRVAAEVADRYNDGVWFVDLVPAGSETDVVTAISAATGLQLRGERALDALVASVSGRWLLLVVDNCEHLTDTVAEVVDVLLGGAPGVSVLATSREPLDLPDERQRHVAPLALEGSVQAPAIAMLVDAAERVGARIDDTETTVALEVATRLDGIPLALELAGAQLRHLTITELRDRLDDRLELLSRRRGRRGRQSSLEVVLEQTWALLDEREERVARQLAAFPSSFSIVDVEEIAEGLDIGPAVTLAGLVDRGIVVADGDGLHRMLETVRLAARQGWPDARGDDHPAERRVRWVLRHGDRGLVQLWLTDDDWSWWHRDDLRTAETELADQGRLDELLVVLAMSAGIDSLHSVTTLDRVLGYLSRPDLDDRQRGWIGLIVAGLALASGRSELIERGGDIAIASFQKDTDPAGLSLALTIASWATVFVDPERAVGQTEDAIELAVETGDTHARDFARVYRATHLGMSHRVDDARAELQAMGADHTFRTPMADYDFIVAGLELVGDPPTARQHAERSFGVGRRNHSLMSLAILAATQGACGDAVEMRATLDRAADVAYQVGSDETAPDLLLAHAALAWERGRHDLCRQWLTAVRRCGRPTLGFPTTFAYRELRGQVGLVDENPLDTMTLQDVHAEAHAWLDSILVSQR